MSAPESRSCAHTYIHCAIIHTHRLYIHARAHTHRDTHACIERTHSLTYGHIFMHSHIHTHTHTLTCMHACMHACIHTYRNIHTCMNTHTQSFIAVFMHSSIHLFIFDHSFVRSCIRTAGTRECMHTFIPHLNMYFEDIDRLCSYTRGRAHLQLSPRDREVRC